MLGRTAFAAAVIVAAAHCGDTNNQKPAPAEAGALCPTSPSAAVGQPCSQEGYSCAVGYLCPGEVWQQAHCACTGGKIACVDATGADVTSGTAPGCNDLAPPSESCGASPADVIGKPCKTAGYACWYKGVTCPNENNNQPYTDDCVCHPVNGSQYDASAGGLAWSCAVHQCQ